ncbi:MAG: hypothetical protein MPJ22_05630 [Pirellulales bacterium]|nr:hypothetical protein [Alphaproteobacteria bacterium]MDA8041882.1 hypothetical protein [Pirellulales bacterium]
MLGFSYGIGQGVITDERESFIWLSIAQANGNERAAKGMRVFDDQPRSVILSARKEAEQRMEEIDRRKEQHDKKFGL